MIDIVDGHEENCMMRPRSVTTASVLVIVLAFAFPAPAVAQWFVDGYLGFAVTANTDVDFGARTPGTPRTLEDVEFDNTTLVGARLGYWLTRTPMLGDMARYLGVDLDVSYFSPDIPGQTVSTDLGPRRFGTTDLSIVTITPEIIGRYPMLVDRDYPDGRLQPYIALGPTVYIASAEGGTTFEPGGGSESDTGVGFVIRPGVAWHLMEQLAVFAEYRFVHVAPTFEFSRGPVDISINSHHFNVGLSWRFGR
jgi:opacity protein-like surface antigen